MNILNSIGFDPSLLGAGAMGATIGFILGVLIVLFFIICIIVYLYKCWAWYTIAKKLKYKNAWLAWIPIAQYFLYPILAKKDWAWGFIVLLPLVLLPLLIIPIAGIIIFSLGCLIVTILKIIWSWNIFEQRKFNGALSLLLLIPIAYLIIIGIIAWSK